MNKVELSGRFTKDPEVSKNGKTSYSQFVLACDRRYRREEGEQNADFIKCVSFGGTAEFIARNFRKGSRIIVCGRIQSNSYTNRAGEKVFNQQVVVEEAEFGGTYLQENAGTHTNTAPENKESTSSPEEMPQNASPETADGFTELPQDFTDYVPFQ